MPRICRQGFRSAFCMTNDKLDHISNAFKNFFRCTSTHSSAEKLMCNILWHNTQLHWHMLRRHLLLIRFAKVNTKHCMTLQMTTLFRYKVLKLAHAHMHTHAYIRLNSSMFTNTKILNCITLTGLHNTNDDNDGM